MSSYRAGVTKEAITEASRTRLCGDLSHLIDHLSSIRQIPNRNSKVCAVCGKDCHHVCMKCVGADGKAGVAMHSFLKLTGEAGEDTTKRVPCYFQYHNTSFFGLARSDYRLGKKKKKDWVAPTQEEVNENRNRISRVLHTRPAPAPAPPAATPPSDGGINWRNVV